MIVKKYLVALVSILVLCVMGCGSSERVISDSGVVYEVKGNRFYKADQDVTETLTKEEKQTLTNKLNARENADKAATKEKQKLENEEAEARQALKKAEKKQKAIEKVRNEKERARKDYFNANDKLKKTKEKYNRLHSQGELSPNDEADWAKKILKLEEQLNKLQKRLNKLEE